MRISSRIKHWIAEAVQTLGLDKADLREIPIYHAKNILKTIKDHFCTRQDAIWWWEYFRENLPHYSKRLNQGYTLLDQIVPDMDEKIWFVIQETYGFRLYLGTISTIQRIIGECAAFEYYLVATDYSWLICENHHDYLIAVGNPVVENFEKLFS